MLLGIPVKQIFEEIGHDGSAIWFPNEPHPYNRRAFHIQEILDVCVKHGYALCEVEYKCVSKGGDIDPEVIVLQSRNRLLKYMHLFKYGLIFSYDGVRRHVYALNNGSVQDPATGKKATEPVLPHVYSFFALIRI